MCIYPTLEYYTFTLPSSISNECRGCLSPPPGVPLSMEGVYHGYPNRSWRDIRPAISIHSSSFHPESLLINARFIYGLPFRIMTLSLCHFLNLRRSKKSIIHIVVQYVSTSRAGDSAISGEAPHTLTKPAIESFSRFHCAVKSESWRASLVFQELTMFTALFEYVLSHIHNILYGT